jgi:putative molybdopterin biosynthesis protein
VQPQLEALRADLERMRVEARDERQQVTTLYASHVLALPYRVRHAASAAALHLDLRYQGSADSLRALSAGRCLVAGFQVPALRGAAPLFAKTLKPLLRPGLHKLIGCSRRSQA